MTALDLCQQHCQVLFITCLRFTEKNVNHAKKEKVCQNAYLLVLRIMNYITSVKSINKGINIKKFPNVHQFCDGDLKKFVLLLRKGVYPYEYMDSWEKFMKLQYQIKKIFKVN